jgi:hypothetical protein
MFTCSSVYILHLTYDYYVLMRLELDAQNFEYFRCDEPKIAINVDMGFLRAVLRTMSDDNSIFMYIYKYNRDVLHIKGTNKYNNNIEIAKLQLMNDSISNRNMLYPGMQTMADFLLRNTFVSKMLFHNEITITSDKFCGICECLEKSSTHVGSKKCDKMIYFITFFEAFSILCIEKFWLFTTKTLNKIYIKCTILYIFYLTE